MCKLTNNNIFCPNCAYEFFKDANFCPKCGKENPYRTINVKTASKKNAIVAFLLCLFFGSFSMHRFYVGKIGSALMQILSCLFVIGYLWVIIDLFHIAFEKFEDDDGHKLKW